MIPVADAPPIRRMAMAIAIHYCDPDEYWHGGFFVCVFVCLFVFFKLRVHVSLSAGAGVDHEMNVVATGIH